MNAQQEIMNAQRDWARSSGIPLNQCGYVREVEANLWRPLSTQARQGFERGAGSELNKNMRAPHSSSALVVNFFDYWTERDKIPILTALGTDPQSGASLDFEARFSAELFTPPHLDVAILLCRLASRRSAGLYMRSAIYAPPLAARAILPSRARLSKMP